MKIGPNFMKFGRIEDQTSWNLYEIKTWVKKKKIIFIRLKKTKQKCMLFEMQNFESKKKMCSYGHFDFWRLMVIFYYKALNWKCIFILKNQTIKRYPIDMKINTSVFLFFGNWISFTFFSQIFSSWDLF